MIYSPSCDLHHILNPQTLCGHLMSYCSDSLSVLSHPECVSLVLISKVLHTEINKIVMIFIVFNRASCIFSSWIFSLQKIKTFPGKLLISWEIFGSRLLEHLVCLCVFSWHKTQKDRLAIKKWKVCSFLSPQFESREISNWEILCDQGIKGKNWGLLQQ